MSESAKQFTGVLKVGSRGPVVKSVKKALNSYASSSEKISDDSTYDKQTAKRVTAYQKENALKPDGRVGPFTYASLFNQSFKFALKSPKVVKQGNKWLCWAAAIESFTGGGRKHNLAALQKRYDKYLGDKGQISDAGLLKVMKDLKLHQPTSVGSALFVEDIYRLLKQGKPILFVTDYSGRTKHAIVLYGVGIEAEFQFVSIMDPLKGRRIAAYSMTSLRDNKAIYIITPKGVK